MKLNRICCVVLFAGALVPFQAFAGVGILKGDAYINSASPSGNFGGAALMNVGGGSAGLVQFDLGPVLSTMTSGVNSDTTALIGRATLTVYVNKAVSAGTLSASPNLGAWTESTVTAGTAPVHAPAVGSSAVSAGNQFVQIDVTAAVRGWLNNNNDPASTDYVGGGNFGLYLDSPDGGVFVLDSKEGTATSHPAQLDIDLATDYNGVLKKTLTLNSPGFTSLMSIHLTGTNTAGGRIWYMIRATDGGSQIATEEGVLQFLATANSITCTVQTADKLHLGTVNSGCTPGFFSPLSQPGVSVFDNVAFSSPAPIVVHEVYFRVLNTSGAVIRLEP